MSLLLALMLGVVPEKSVGVRTVAVPPRIDGRIEDVWLAADSAVDFAQEAPDEGEPVRDRTVVYLLQDDANLYVAFRCWSPSHPPVAQLYGVEDEVTFFIDPTGSGDFGYFFKTYCSGLYHDGLMLDDGASQDWSWDCVWYTAVFRGTDRFEVEMRIPFKSIRYKPDLAEWGVNFARHVAATRESQMWKLVPEREGGSRVSNAGRLTGIAPRQRGYYFELYPEGFARYDEVPPAAGKVRPSASLNLKWDLSPQTSLTGTVLPDFAQIEADPYSFNLSRYPVLLAERRPFFVEGNEFFRMSTLGGDGSFTPLRIFYSRSIGRAIRGEPVPILSGLKLVSRSGGSSYGLLGAYTRPLDDSARGISEPARGFAVLSGRTALPDRNNLGLLFAGTVAAADNYNYALGSDFAFGEGPHRGAVQAAFSDRNGKLGWAFESGYAGMHGNIVSNAALEAVSDSFDVGDIGYVPWAGRVSMTAGAGPLITTRGALRRMTIVPQVGFYREPGNSELSYNASVNVNPQFRNGWGAYAAAAAGRTFEADTGYFSRSWHLSAWASDLRANLNLNGGGSHAYNYARGYLADNYWDNVNYTYYIAGRVAVMLGLFNGWELDPAGRLAGVTSSVSPRIDFRINSKVAFNVYNEMVLLTPEARFEETEFYSNRVGCLFSWNFLPKSWLYVAFNDFRVDSEEGLALASRIGAVKVRYLFYI